MTHDYPVNYTPKSMSFAAGYLGPSGSLDYVMTFSMKKAKEIVEALDEEGAEVFRAVGGLDGDFLENHGPVYDGEIWTDPNFWTYSIWATPILQVYTPFEKLTFACWKKEKK